MVAPHRFFSALGLCHFLGNSILGRCYKCMSLEGLIKLYVSVSHSASVDFWRASIFFWDSCLSASSYNQKRLDIFVTKHQLCFIRCWIESLWFPPPSMTHVSSCGVCGILANNPRSLCLIKRKRGGAVCAICKTRCELALNEISSE